MLEIFPGAVGHGRFCVGGRGGSVYRINTISNGTAPVVSVGDGTFRTSFKTALAQSGPKIIIFEISGTIDFGATQVSVSGDFVTIAGQTAPSPGITIRAGRGFLVGGAHILLQHFRIGSGGDIASSAGSDVLATPNGSGGNLYWDHMSVRWGTDENIANRDPNDMTVDFCITSEALHNPPTRPGANHSNAMRFGYPNERVSIVRNLIALAHARNPRMSNQGSLPTSFEVINNYIYGYRSKGTQNSGSVVSDIISNFYDPGPFSGASEVELSNSTNIQKAYVQGNVGPSWLVPNAPQDWTGVSGNVANRSLSRLTSVTNVPIIDLSTNTLTNEILPNIGARPLDRDAVDARILSLVASGGGAIIDHENEVGGYPALAVNPIQHVLPENFNDVMANGYTKLEDWLHQKKLEVETGGTSPPPPFAGETFAVFGDYGNNSAPEGEVAAIVNDRATAVITTGDNNYGVGAAATIDTNIGQYYSNYIGNYQGSFGQGAVENLFFPCPGNHDHRSGVGGGGLGPYLDYFTLPGVGVMAGSVPSGFNATTNPFGRTYYDFILADIHFFMLDTGDSNNELGAQQLTWLQTATALSTARWKVAVMHHPPFSSSNNHGSHPALQLDYAGMGIQLVFGGHDHTYERIVTGGVTYIVTGLGGAGRYNFGNPVPGSLVRYNAINGAVFMTALSNGSLNLEFVNTAGDVIDSFTMGASIPPGRFTLLVAKNPPNGGTVTQVPPPVGGTYALGTVVTVTQVANPGFTNAGFSGDVATPNPSLILVMDSDTNLIANFTPDAPTGELVMANPSNGEVVSGMVDLTAVGTPPITAVSYWVDDVRVSSVIRTAPFTFLWDSTGVADGLHTVFARATVEGDAQTIDSPTISVTVRNITPSEQTCGKLGTIDLGEYKLQNNIWSADTPQCISAVRPTGFHVDSSGHNKILAGPPASFPSIWKGWHWNDGTLNSGLPIRASNLLSAKFSLEATLIQQGAWNLIAESWFKTTPEPGTPDGAELMLWLNNMGGIQPGGSVVGIVVIEGITWEVWYMQSDWNFVIYRSIEPLNSASLIDMNLFIQDAISRGYIDPNWYLMDLEAGFELWQGGAGLQMDSFSFDPVKKSVEPGDEWGIFTVPGSTNLVIRPKS